MAMAMSQAGSLSRRSQEDEGRPSMLGSRKRVCRMAATSKTITVFGNIVSATLGELGALKRTAAICRNAPTP